MRCDDVIRELAVPTDERDRTALAEHLARCPACTAWAKRATGLDRLWEATRPPEPSSEAWDTLWAHLAHSLDLPTSNEVATFTSFVPSQNGSRAEGEPQPIRPHPSSRSHRGRWVVIGLIGVAQAAAVLLAVGLSWRIFTPSQPPQVGVVADSTSPASASLLKDKVQPTLEVVRISVPPEGFPTVVDEGTLMVIHADPKPRTMLLPIFSSHSMFVIQVEGQIPTVVNRTPAEASFGVDDWLLGFHAVESLANTEVVMKE